MAVACVLDDITWELDATCCVIQLISKTSGLPLYEFFAADSIFISDGNGGVIVKDPLSIIHVRQNNFPQTTVGPPADSYSNATELIAALKAWRDACCTPA